MMAYKRLMDAYEGNQQQFVVDSVLEVGERKHILVTHDECTFYSNDGQKGT